MPHMKVNFFGANLCRVMSDYPGFCEWCHKLFRYGDERYKWATHEAHEECFAKMHYKTFGSYPMVIKAGVITEEQAKRDLQTINGGEE